MIFSKKYAKLGRANSASLRKRTDGTFDVLLSNVQTVKRSLSVDGTTYNMGPVNSTFIYNQMTMISDSLCVASIDANNFSVVEVENSGT